MRMLAYQTLDFFDDKQKIKGAARQQNQPQEPTYLGLMMETFVEYFCLDIYGYISNTNYKYIIIKHENKTNALGQKPSDTPIKNLFKNMIRVHTELILNPFFDPFEKPEEDNDEEINVEKQNDDLIYMATFRAKIDEMVNYYENQI